MTEENSVTQSFNLMECLNLPYDEIEPHSQQIWFPEESYIDKNVQISIPETTSVQYLNGLNLENVLSPGTWPDVKEMMDLDVLRNEPHTNSLLMHTNTPDTNHILKQSVKRQYQCGYCPLSFNYELNLSVHRLSEHTLHQSSDSAKQNPVACPFCEKHFSRLAAFKCHVRFHHVEDDFVCSYCSKLYPSQQALSSHVLQHVNGCSDTEMCSTSSNQYRCRLCLKINSSVFSLRTHYREFHPSKQNKKNNIDNAPAEVQNAESETLPNDESKSRRSKAKAKNYIKKLMNPLRKPPHGELSANVITTIDIESIEFDKYILTVAKTKKKSIFTCLICQKKHDSLALAKRHLISHLGIRPFSCSICSKSYSQMSSAITHMAVHNPSTNLFCDHCGKTFNFKHNLAKHALQFHPVNKSVKTPPAEQPFDFKFLFNLPLRISMSLISKIASLLSITTEYHLHPYQCRYCFFSFTNQFALQSHIILHIRKNFLLSYKQLIGTRFKVYQSLNTKQIASKQPSFQDLKNHKTHPQLFQLLENNPCNKTHQRHINAFNNKSFGSRVVSTPFLKTGGKFSCPHCIQHFEKRSILKKHLVIHQHRRQQKIGIFSRFISNLLKTKLDNQSKPCPKCCQELIGRKDIILHFIYHYLSQFFVCSHCKSRFSCALLLSRHIKQNHFGIKAYPQIVFFENLPENIKNCFSKSQYLKSRKNRCKLKSKKKAIRIQPDNIRKTSELPITQDEESIYNFSENLGGSDSNWFVLGTRILVVPSADNVNTPILVSNQIANSELPVMYEPTDYGISSGDLYILQPQQEVGEIAENNILCSDTVPYTSETNQFSQDDIDYQTTEFVAQLDYGTTSFSEQQHQTHSDLQLNENLFVCNLCPARFSTGLALQQHIELPHQTARLLVCTTCGVSKTDITNTQPCPICGLTSNFQEMEAIIEVDKQQPRYACGHCAVAFTEISLLEAHLTELIAETASTRMLIGETNISRVATTINPQQQQPASFVRCRRTSSNVARKNSLLQLPEEEIERLMCTQPTNTISVSERLLIEAACERNTVSYPRELKHTINNGTNSSKRSSSSSSSVCSICSRGFARVADLRRHMYLHTGVRPHGCNLCPKRFILRHRMLRHLLNDHGSEGRTIALRALTRNRKKNQILLSVDTTYTCHVCGLQCRTRTGLRGHLRSHTNTNIYACNRCGCLFRSPMQRKRHLSICLQQPLALQQTPADLEVTDETDRIEEEQVFDLANYFLTLPPIEEEKEQESSYKDLLINESVPFECVDLDEVVAPPMQSITSKFHPLSKPKQRRRSYVKVGDQIQQLNRVDSYCTVGSQCNKCQAVFSSERAFQTHSCVSSSTSFDCATCGKSFSALKKLRRHLTTHLSIEERPFGCRVCGSRFTQRGALDMHERTHFDDRWFRCRFCALRFVQKTNMLRHIAKEHQHNTEAKTSKRD